jgi:hypothetical protein
MSRFTIIERPMLSTPDRDSHCSQYANGQDDTHLAEAGDVAKGDQGSTEDDHQRPACSEKEMQLRHRGALSPSLQRDGVAVFSIAALKHAHD